MTVSVIIPTLNAGKQISKLILILRNQTVCPHEVIIIDSSSDDNTTAIATELDCKTAIIDRASFDHGGTRNYGARLATGNILLFLTQDVIPYNDHLIENLIAPLLDSQAAASFARQIAKTDANPPEQFARRFNYPSIHSIKSADDLSAMGIKTFFFSNACSATIKEAYYEVGCFPEKIIMNEDMILAAKLILSGKNIAYCPDAMVWHSHNYSINQYFKRYFDIGAAFSMSKWLLNYAKAEEEGIYFVIKQLQYLISEHHVCWIPYSLTLIMAKFLGYKLGIAQNKLPVKLKKYFSANKNFWN